MSGKPTGRSAQRSQDRLRHSTGIVIPVYLPNDVDRDPVIALLHDTVAGCCLQIADPASICLSVDGAENGAAVAQQLAEAYGVTIAISPVNRGKLQGVREGARQLIDQRDPAYIGFIDCDSDHFPNEMLNFVRAAEHIVDQTGDDRLLMLGRRISRHRPMGLLRGELEDLADRMLAHALAYHAAVVGVPLRLEYATLLEQVPDYHSGYKLFSRRSAAAVFLSDPQLAGLSDTAYYRHAVEAVMVVEAVLSGARLGVINRSTYNRQPVTAFGRLDRADLTADMIIWPCKRLGVPPHFVRQWLHNELPALLLSTLIPEGRDELEAVYREVLAAFGGVDDIVDPFATSSLFI